MLTNKEGKRAALFVQSAAFLFDAMIDAKEGTHYSR